MTQTKMKWCVRCYGRDNEIFGRKNNSHLSHRRNWNDSASYDKWEPSIQNLFPYYSNLSSHRMFDVKHVTIVEIRISVANWIERKKRVWTRIFLFWNSHSNLNSVWTQTLLVMITPYIKNQSFGETYIFFESGPNTSATTPPGINSTFYG